MLVWAFKIDPCLIPVYENYLAQSAKLCCDQGSNFRAILDFYAPQQLHHMFQKTDISNSKIMKGPGFEHLNRSRLIGAVTAVLQLQHMGIGHCEIQEEITQDLNIVA